MQVLRINPYNTRNINNKNCYNTVSFGNRSQKSEQEIIKIFGDRFNELMCIRNLEDNSLDEFFMNLQRQPISIKEAFIKSEEIHNYEPIFARLVRWDDKAARVYLDFIKNSEEQIKDAFFCPDNNPFNTPFVKAAELENYQLADDLFEYLLDDNAVSSGIRRNVFNLKIQDTEGVTRRVGDAVREAGHPVLATKMDKVEYKYRDPIVINGANASRLAQQKEKEKDAGGRYTVVENSKIKFADIGGMFNVKKEIQKQFLSILRNPKAKNSDKPGALLLHGTPGTGKTLLAMGIAGEAGVPFISATGSSFVEVYVGAGAKHVRELYNQAREVAKNHPSKTAIVFIDEIDAVGGKRGSGNNGERDATLNALLTEMDGVMSKQNDDIKIITIAATNRADMLDSALRGRRFDLEFTIDDPRFSEKARKEIINIHLKDKPFENETEKNRIINHISKISAGMSGADIEKLIKRAYREMLSEERDFISYDDIKAAYLSVRMGVVNDSEIIRDEVIKTIAHEAGHAICGLVMTDIMKNEKELQKRPVSELDCIINESRGHAAGATFYKPSDNHRYTIESLITSLVTTYGGYSVEETLYDSHTDGVCGDLNANTDRIVSAICNFGLGSKTRYISTSSNNQIFELFKWDIKKDILNYSNIGMEIANKISAFSAPFIEEYANSHYDKSEKIISGEMFTKMYNDWIKTSGREDEYRELCLQIRKDVETFANKMRNK